MNLFKQLIIGLTLGLFLLTGLFYINIANANPTDWHNNDISQHISNQTLSERCDDRGGVWNGKYCLARPMTQAEIDYATQYTQLKQIEMREVKNATIPR